MNHTKNNFTNLESKRGLFFYTGLLIAASLTLLAFEWTTFQTEHRFVQSETIRDYDDPDMYTMPNFKEKVELQKPVVKNPQLFQQINATQIVENAEDKKGDVNNENDLEGDVSDVGDLDPNLFVSTITPIDEGFIEDFPTNFPEYPGGYGKMKEFLGENTRYPSIDISQGRSGTVYVRFVVSKKGEISDVEILSAPSETLAKEAERVVRLMPKWKPGENNGRKVNVRFTLPIEFKLK